MKKKIIFLFISLCTISLLGCENQVHIDKDLEIVKDSVLNERTDSIKEKIKNMTLEEKIGQLLIVGFDGEDIDSKLMEYIDELHIGGLIFFKRNLKSYEQIVAMINNIKDYNKNKIPLFLSIDEEGGLVSRMPDEFIKLPDSILLENKTENSKDLGRILAMRLKSIGMNLNFAPVMDINSNEDNPVIGNRATGRNPDIVKENTFRIVEGMKEENIMAVGKHFPGHGDTKVDSHLELPIINKSKEDLMNFEIKPFEYNINRGLDGIMVGHLLLPSLDDKPASVSSIILKDLLREELNYKGLIFSDDMTMSAITKDFKVEDAAVEFLLSGGDQVLLCHGLDTPIKVMDLMVEKVKTKEITEAEVDEKVYRILQVKKKYGLDNNKIKVDNLNKINNKSLEYIKKIGG